MSQKRTIDDELVDLVHDNMKKARDDLITFRKRVPKYPDTFNGNMIHRCLFVLLKHSVQTYPTASIPLIHDGCLCHFTFKSNDHDSQWDEWVAWSKQIRDRERFYTCIDHPGDGIDYVTRQKWLAFLHAHIVTFIKQKIIAYWNKSFPSFHAEWIMNGTTELFRVTYTGQ